MASLLVFIVSGYKATKMPKGYFSKVHKLS